MPRIEIVDHQPTWAAEFRRVAGRLREALGPTALAIWHIGSTSVPGLDAKDVIDVQVRVAALEPVQSLRQALADAGYRPHGTLDHDHVPAGEDPSPDRWVKLQAGQPPGQRRVHVHIRVHGRPNERYALLFRDYLRASPTAAANYGLAKRALATLHPDDVDAYYLVKEPVCDLVMDAAELWAERTGWILPATDA